MTNTNWNTLYAMEPSALRNIISSGGAGKPIAVPYDVVGNVAQVSIVGPICKYAATDDDECGGVSTLQIQQNIQRALDDATIDSIVLVIDSPGGTVAGTMDLADFVFASRAVKPIIAYVSDNCMSGAYWIACSCTKIIANAGAYIGSIGVYGIATDSSRAARAQGLDIIVTASGEYKGIEVDGVPVTDKLISENQKRVDASADLFKAAVQRGRGLSANAVTVLADGRVHIASAALAMSMIDGIGCLADAMNPKAKVKGSGMIKANGPVLAKVATAFSDLSASIVKLVAMRKAAAAAPRQQTPEEKRMAGIVASVGTGAGKDAYILKAFAAGLSPAQAKAAEHDAELQWKWDVGSVQKSHSGNKAYFLADLAHTAKAKATADRKSMFKNLAK